MAQEHLSAVAFRHIIFATETGEGGIDNFSTAILPDGALAYAVDVGTEYRLHKDLTGSTITGAQVAGAGGGLWLATSAASSGIGFHWATEIVADEATLSGTWAALPSGTNYWTDLGSSAFSTSTTTGVVTYNGSVAFRALVTAQVSFVDTGEGPLVYVLGVSLNGTFLGAGTFPTNYAWGVVAQNAQATLITHQFYSPIAPGDTIQPMMRLNAGNADPTIVTAQMIIQPAGI